MAYAKGVEYVANKYALRQNFKSAKQWMQRMDKVIVVSIDADIRNIRPTQVAGLVRPLLKLPVEGKTRRKWHNMVIGTRVMGAGPVRYEPYNGERAIRLRSLQALRRGKKKWEALLSAGYGLETALNLFIPELVYANTKFHLGRKPEAKHEPGYIGTDMRLADDYLKTRKDIADKLWEIRESFKEKGLKKGWLAHMRRQERQARELVKLKSQKQRKRGR